MIKIENRIEKFKNLLNKNFPYAGVEYKYIESSEQHMFTYRLTSEKEIKEFKVLANHLIETMFIHNDIKNVAYKKAEGVHNWKPQAPPFVRQPFNPFGSAGGGFTAQSTGGGHFGFEEAYRDFNDRTARAKAENERRKKRAEMFNEGARAASDHFDSVFNGTFEYDNDDLKRAAEELQEILRKQAKEQKKRGKQKKDGFTRHF